MDINHMEIQRPKQYEGDDVGLLAAILAYTDDEFAHLKADHPMTQELWEYLLMICIRDSKKEKYNELWTSYPELADHMMSEFDRIAAQNPLEISPEETQAKFEEFKKTMRDKYGEDFI